VADPKLGHGPGDFFCKKILIRKAKPLSLLKFALFHKIDLFLDLNGLLLDPPLLISSNFIVRKSLEVTRKIWSSRYS